MALSTQPYKGARDFYPNEKRVQNFMFQKLRKVVRSYGYSEYDAPILEPLELYAAKTGDEIVNEQTYRFTDRGGREVAIRPEMTPTVSRMVAAKRQELGYPLRLFSIPNLWRYERPQHGRLREHWQLNVDIFGEEGVAADHEIISVADDIMRAFGATRRMYSFKINSRSLMDAIFTKYLGLNANQTHDLSKLIDRMHKVTPDQLNQTVDQIAQGMLDDVPTKIHTLLKVKTLTDLPEEVQMYPESNKLSQFIDSLQQSGITNAEFDISIMRGFDYYTDIIFEAYDTDPTNNRSMFGGGRYDGLVGLFGVDPVPTAGFGMGDVMLEHFLRSHDLLPELPNETDLLMVLIGDDVYPKAHHLAQELREMGINVSVDATSRKIDKKIKSADKQSIRYVLFVGEQELQEEQYALKDLVTGREERHSASRIVSIIQDYRNRNSHSDDD